MSSSLQETLSRAKMWLEELEKRFLPDEIVIALVGNKTDLADEREVTTEVSAWGSSSPLTESTGIHPRKNSKESQEFKGFSDTSKVCTLIDPP